VAAPRFVEIKAGEALAVAGREAALFVLEGRLTGHAAGDLLPGDALVGPPADLASVSARESTRLLVEERDTAGAGPARRIGRADLVGTGVTGITGVRVLHRAPGGTLLRLGPPPGARWILVGLRGFAVLAGHVFLYEVLDASEPKRISAGGGHVARDPSRPAPLLAGNDSAVVVAHAAPDVTVTLG